MKYPQLVSMPSAVSDWLEEQLEARGIDAVVYTRYVLSLLHRDPYDFPTSDPDFIGFEQLKGVGRSGSGSRGRKRLRVRSGNALPPDQMRRSAAVQCLMSASEQSCGIESLVDELCAKLKESEKGSANSLEYPIDPIIKTTNDVTPLSAHDLARRYYAAFPALNSKSCNAEQPNSVPLQNPSWASLANKLISKNPPTSESHESQEQIWDTMRAICINKQQSFPSFCRSKRELGFNCSTRIMAKSAERSEGTSLWDDQVNWYNQHNQLVTTGPADEGYATSDTMVQLDEELPLTITQEDYSPSQQHVDDVEKLAAKFGRSIESIWSPDTSIRTEEPLPQHEDDFQDLPVDFQELLASPTEHPTASAEIFGLVNKNLGFIQRPQSFIQCGTNITSSIWSNQDNMAAADSTDFGNNERSFYEANYFDNTRNHKIKPQIIGKDFWAEENINVMEHENNRQAFYENFAFSNLNNNISMNNDASIANRSNYNYSWEFGFAMGDVSQQKWSEAESLKTLQSTRASTPVNLEIEASLSKLNHDRDLSMFTEVVPNQCRRNVFLYDRSPSPTGSVLSGSAGSAFEDDLLTSRRTHFCPIRVVAGRYHPSNIHLPDGSSFDIHGSPDHVTFRRTDSGTMFLDSDLDSESEYMEYKGKCLSLSSLDSDCSDDENSVVPAETSDFVLKFRVRQNGKSCQTDSSELEAMAADSPQEVLPPKRRTLTESIDLLLSENKELGNIMDMNSNCTCMTELSLDDEKHGWFAEGKTAACEECGVWPPLGRSPAASGLWGGHIWSSCEEVGARKFGSVVVGGEGCGEGVPLEKTAPEVPHSLRDELQREGEQLLSDISSLQRLYLFDLNVAGDERPLSSREERKRRHSASLRSAAAPWHPAPTPLKALRSLTF